MGEGVEVFYYVEHAFVHAHLFYHFLDFLVWLFALGVGLVQLILIAQLLIDPLLLELLIGRLHILQQLQYHPNDTLILTVPNGHIQLILVFQRHRLNTFRFEHPKYLPCPLNLINDFHVFYVGLDDECCFEGEEERAPDLNELVVGVEGQDEEVGVFAGL